MKQFQWLILALFLSLTLSSCNKSSSTTSCTAQDPVIIVGAGMTGLITAYELSDYSLA